MNYVNIWFAIKVWSTVIITVVGAGLLFFAPVRRALMSWLRAGKE